MKRISSSKLPEADDRADLQMGLGKTAQVAAFLGALGRARLLRSVLIVAPATVLSHWNTELNRWAPMLRTIILHRVASAFDAAAARGTNARDMFVTHALSLRPAVACVTTYDGLRQLRAVRSSRMAGATLCWTRVTKFVTRGGSPKPARRMRACPSISLTACAISGGHDGPLQAASNHPSVDHERHSNSG